MTARLRSLKAPVSYSIPEAVEATGLSETVIKEALASGALTKHYVRTTVNGEPIAKPVIHWQELSDWVLNAPTERVS